jgi:hypothetical protein
MKSCENMKIKLLRNTLLFTAAICGVISAQSMLGYEYPTGIPISPSAGPSLSLARTGVGIQNDFLAMTKNPANLGGVQRAVFSSVLAYDLVNIQDDGKSSSQQLFNPELLSFAFPLGRYGAIGLSIDQRSITDLKFHVKRDTVIDGTGFSQELGTIRKGGIVAWQAGYGYSIKKYARLGLTYERIYFTDRNTNTKQISGAITSNLTDSTEFVFRGNGIRGGIQVPYKKFTGGISGEYIFLNQATQTRLAKNVESDDTTINSSQNFDYQPAPSLSFGASYAFSPEWLAAADLDITFWDHFYSQLGTTRALSNAISASAGGQFIPAPNLLAPKYYEIIQYRAGLRFTQMPVSSASEMAFDIGVGLPLQQGGSIFDVNFEYGRRWDSNYKNYYEQFFSIQLGINGGRKWYQTNDTSY